jgi:hypothetical protein
MTVPRLAACLIAPLLLAACATTPPPTGPRAVCESNASRDPRMKDLVMHEISNPYFESQNHELIMATRAQVVQDCLKRQGILPQGGGVQPEATENSLF